MASVTRTPNYNTSFGFLRTLVDRFAFLDLQRSVLDIDPTNFSFIL